MIGNRLAEVRGNQSREAFAKKLAVHAQTLGRYEKGERVPDADFLARFCKRLKINANWLLLEIGPMELSERQEKECRMFPPFIESLIDDLSKERETNRKLAQENRELMKENRDIYVELAETKARDAPSDESNQGVQKSA